MDFQGEEWATGVIERELGIVPWLMNYMPSISCVFDVIRDIDYGYVSGNSHIFIDAKGLEEGTCVISHWLGVPVSRKEDGDQEFARADMQKAVYYISIAKCDESWFPKFLGKE